LTAKTKRGRSRFRDVESADKEQTDEGVLDFTAMAQEVEVDDERRTEGIWKLSESAHWRCYQCGHCGVRRFGMNWRTNSSSSCSIQSITKTLEPSRNWKYVEIKVVVTEHKDDGKEDVVEENLENDWKSLEILKMFGNLWKS